jgi:hypothetical protein
MKKFTGIALMTALAAAMAVAGDSDKPSSKTQTINGYLVDVACARENAMHPEPGFAAKHDKGCLQMDECVQTGYAILTEDNRIIRFDKQSNDTAKSLIAGTDKKDNWKITATGVMNGDTFSAQSLKLQ